MIFNRLLKGFKSALNKGNQSARIVPPIALPHGLMVSGNPSHAFACLEEIIPINPESMPQVLVLPRGIAESEPFAGIPEIPQITMNADNDSKVAKLTVSQVSMAIQRLIISTIDEASEEEAGHLSILQTALGYLSDAKGGDAFTDPSQLLGQVAELSSPGLLLQRIIDPLTVMPELGSAIRLIQSYSGFSFSLIDHAKLNPETAFQDKFKGKQLKAYNSLLLAHTHVIAKFKSLIDKVAPLMPSVDTSALQHGHRYKMVFDPDSSMQFLMQVFSVTQTAFKWRTQQIKRQAKTKPREEIKTTPLDLIILLDASDVFLPNVSQDLYALAHHLWSTRGRTDNNIRLFVNWPIAWQEREQGKPMPLHGRILQGANAYYGPETDIIPAFRDVYGDRSPTQMNAIKDKTKAEIDIMLAENDQKYAPDESYFGWIIGRQIFTKKPLN